MNTTPTPRTDAMQRIQFEGCECIVAAPEDIEQLELSLHEARWANDDLLKRLNERVIAHIEVDRERLASIGAHKQDAERLAAALRIWMHADRCFCEASFSMPDGSHPRHTDECEKSTEALREHEALKTS